MRPWARIENFLSMYSFAYDGFCKRFCPIAEYKVTSGVLLNWLEREEYLWSCGVCWQDGFGGMCCLIGATIA